jgi:hypothetical protein
MPVPLLPSKEPDSPAKTRDGIRLFAAVESGAFLSLIGIPKRTAGPSTALRSGRDDKLRVVLPFKVGLWEGRTCSSVDPTNRCCMEASRSPLPSLNPNNRSQMEAPPSPCHPERSRGTCSSPRNPMSLRESCPKAKEQQLCIRAPLCLCAPLISPAKRTAAKPRAPGLGWQAGTEGRR